jgi:hypothetical protein
MDNLNVPSYCFFLGLTEHLLYMVRSSLNIERNKKNEERQKSMSTTTLEEEIGRLKATKNEFDI